MIGTMIEVLRAALTADRVAETAEFFSFGTNDLTQMTLGFSRDDSGNFMGAYLEQESSKRTCSSPLTKRALVPWLNLRSRKAVKRRKI